MNERQPWQPSTMNKLTFFFQGDELFVKLIKNSSYLFFASLISSLIGFVQSIILARYLGVAQYGLLALVFSYTAIVNQFFDFRVWEMITKYVAEYWSKNEKGKCLATIKLGYGIDVVSSLAAVLITILLSKPVARVVFHKPEVADILVVYAFSLLVTNVSNSSSAVLKVFDRFSWVGAQNVGRSVLSIVLIGIAVVLKWDLKSIIITYLATALISGGGFLFLAYVTIRKYLLGYKIDSRLRELKGRLKEKGKFLFYTNMNGFLSMFRDNFDTFILGYFRGPTEVGWYKVAKNFVTIFLRITDPVCYALYPQLSGLWVANKKTEIRNLVLKVSKTMAVLVGLIILFTLLFAPSAIKMAVGQDYLNSATALRVLVCMMAWAVLIWAGSLLLAAGRPELAFRAMCISILVTVAAQLILIPRWGYIGASLAYTINHFSWMVIVILILSRYKVFGFLFHAPLVVKRK
ncbi:MAG: flippase [Candidatus Marinimicrobia bacterium]|nr:flippase [Candidatus Neomarinimicrobiota bacterium]